MVIADRVVGIILLLLAAACLTEGIRVWDGFGGTGFMPAILGFLFAFLSPGLLFRKSHGKKNEVILWPARNGWQQIGFILASFGLYTLLVPWLGYLATTTLFLTGLLRVMGKVRWEFGLIFGLAVSGSTFVIFKIWLNMPLPAGPLGA